DGTPASEEAENPLLIERELTPGLHTIEFWRHENRGDFLKSKPVILCDDNGKPELVACQSSMFDPSTFPENVRATIPQPAVVKNTPEGKMEVAFGDQTRARIVRLVINGFEGVAPTIK
ncbi:MAG: hypothetical protein ACK5TA_04295, partial [bacterium]